MTGPYLLKGGHITNDRRLDRIYQLDLRSLGFQVTLPERMAFRSMTYAVGTWLDQGTEGACPGFGFAHELLARPQVVAGVSERYAHDDIYWAAQRVDEWPGGSYPGADPQYEGSSVLAAAKVVREAGFYSEYRWALSAREAVAALGYHGPIVLGVNWYDGMYDTDPDGFLHVHGPIVGGHCILAHRVRIVPHEGVKYNPAALTWDQVDLVKSYVTVWNSWGKTWGWAGTGKLSLADLAQLIDVEHGECCVPIRTDKRSV